MEDKNNKIIVQEKKEQLNIVVNNCWHCLCFV